MNNQKIVIEVGNVRSSIIGELSDRVLKRLDTKLSYEVPGAYYARKFNKFAGIVKLFSTLSKAFPTGLIHYVLEIFCEEGISCHLKDTRPQVSLGQELPVYGFTFRDYQQEAVDKAVKMQRGIVKMATGSGKTNIFTGIIAKLNVPTLILIHKTDIFYQIINRLETSLKIPIGRIGDEVKDLKPISVAMIQTLASCYTYGRKKEINGKMVIIPDSKEIVAEKKKVQEYIKNVNCVITDECFIGGEKVITTEGLKSLHQIYDLYNKGHSCYVLSFNTNTKLFETKKITNVFRKKVNERLLKIKFSRKKTICTSNHLFLTNNGWKPAFSLTENDLIFSYDGVKSKRANLVSPALNSDQLQIVLGSFLGDGNLQSSSNVRYRLRVIHGKPQTDYCKWKANLFNVATQIVEKNGFSQKPAIKFTTKCFDLGNLFPKTKKSCPQWILEKLDVRGLAIWYMDDGSVNHKGRQITLHTSSFDKKSQYLFIKKLLQFGIKSHLMYVVKKDGRRFPIIRIGVDSYFKFIDLVRPYIHPSMSYKIYKKSSNLYIWNANFLSYSYSIIKKIVQLSQIEMKKHHMGFLYDLEVVGNSNYIVCGCNRLSKSKPIGIIAHNCHHVPSDSFSTVLRKAENAIYRIGMSASPWREDRADLLIEALQGKILIDVSASQLIDDGYLVSPLFQLFLFHHERKSRENMKYSDIYDIEVVNNFDRNKLIIEIALKAVTKGKSVLIAVTKIEHGQILEAMLQQIEPTSIFVFGESESELRKTVLAELNDKKRKIVIATTIYGEGVDIPTLSVLINAKAAASSVDSFQLAGRVLRKPPNKNKAYIVDIFDIGCKFLEAHSNAREKIYKTEPRYILKDIENVSNLTFDDGAW